MGHEVAITEQKTQPQGRRVGKGVKLPAQAAFQPVEPRGAAFGAPVYDLVQISSEARDTRYQPGKAPQPAENRPVALPSEPIPDNQLIGRVLEGNNGRWRIERKLGAGGHAVVYLAEDLGTGRKAAVKIAIPGSVEAAALANESVRLRQANQGSNPNVMQIWDFGSNEGINFLVGEYIEGRTVSAALRAGDISVTEAAEIIYKVMPGWERGVSQRGTVHRDIKPGNIMFHQDPRTGEITVVKLIDFGVAVPVGKSAAPANKEGVIDIYGTIDYCSPEQSRGERLTPASDVFSFGVTLFEMISGRRPFAEKEGSVLKYHELTPADFRSFPSPLRELLPRMLRLDPAMRPRSEQIMAETGEYIRREEASYRAFKGAVESGVNTARAGTSAGAGTIVYFRENNIDPAFEDQVRKAFPENEGFVVFRSDRKGKRGIFVYGASDQAGIKAKAKALRHANGRITEAYVIVRAVDANISAAPEQAFEGNLRVVTSNGARDEAYLEQEADAFIKKYYNPQDGFGKQREGEIRRKLAEMKLSPQMIEAKIYEMRLARIRQYLGPEVAARVLASGIDIMAAPSADLLARQLGVFRKSGDPAALISYGYDPEKGKELRPTLDAAFQKWEADKASIQADYALVESWLSGDRPLTRSEYVKARNFLDGLVRRPKIAKMLGLTREQAVQRRDKLDAARIADGASAERLPPDVAAAFTELNRILATPETAKRLREYLTSPEGREKLLKSEEGRKLLTEIEKIARNGGNWQESLRVQGVGLLVGLATLIGAEKLADLLGIESKPGRFVFILGISHLANTGAQGLIVGAEMAEAAKIVTALRGNPTLFARAMAQFKGIAGGLGQMAFVSILASGALEITGVNPEIREYVTLGTSFVVPAAGHFALGQAERVLGGEAAAVLGAKFLGRLATGIGAASFLTDGAVSIFASNYRLSVNKRVYDSLQTQRVTQGTGGLVSAGITQFVHTIAGSAMELADVCDNPQAIAPIIQQDIASSRATRVQLVGEIQEYLAGGGDISVLTRKAEWGTIRVSTGSTPVPVYGPNGVTVQVLPGQNISEQEVFAYMQQYAKEHPEVKFGSPEYFSGVSAHFDGKITTAHCVEVLKKGQVISWQGAFAMLHLIEPAIFSHFSGSTANNDIRTWFDSNGALRGDQVAAFQKGFLRSHAGWPHTF